MKPILRKTASKAVSDACEDTAFATKCEALQEHDYLWVLLHRFASFRTGATVLNATEEAQARSPRKATAQSGMI